MSRCSPPHLLPRRFDDQPERHFEIYKIDWVINEHNENCSLGPKNCKKSIFPELQKTKTPHAQSFQYRDIPVLGSYPSWPYLFDQYWFVSSEPYASHHDCQCVKYTKYLYNITYTVVEPDREAFVKAHRDKWVKDLKSTYEKIRKELESTGVLVNWIKARFALEVMASVGYGTYLNSTQLAADLKKLIDITKRLKLPDMSNSRQFKDKEIEKLSYFLKSIRAFAMEKPPLLVPSEEVFEGEDIGLGFPAKRRQAIEKASFYNLLDPETCKL